MRLLQRFKRPVTPQLIKNPWLMSLVGALAMAAVLLSGVSAWATELPAGVMTYLRHKDPLVRVRFDGLVLFSNGESYVPVIPQDPALNPDSQQVIATVPEKSNYPDLIQFDNHFFLIRLIQTSSGRLTFPKLEQYPIQLKEGLLPQDFVLPNNLFIPVELKVLLGALPYNPSFTPLKPNQVVPVATTLRNTGFGNRLKAISKLTYVFDITDQKILSIDPLLGRKQGEVLLDCVPSALALSPDGKLLFAPCLSSNELAVIDTGSNLVKTRIPVGQRPDHALYLDKLQKLVVSNRYSPFLSVINAQDLSAGQRIDLPGNGGVAIFLPGPDDRPKILVADAAKPQIYLVDLTTAMVEKTYPAQPDISALKAFKNPAGQLEIWVLSRDKSQLSVMNAEGVVLKTLDVGKKPVDMAVYKNKLIVVSAGNAELNVIDRATQSLLPAIPLEADSFPSGIGVSASERLAYVSLAASNNLVVIDLDGQKVESTLPVGFRASLITILPEAADNSQTTSEQAGPAPAVGITVGRSTPATPTTNKPRKKFTIPGFSARLETVPASLKAPPAPSAAVVTSPQSPANPPKESAPAAPNSLSPSAQPSLSSKNRSIFSLKLGHKADQESKTAPPVLENAPAQASKAGARLAPKTAPAALSPDTPSPAASSAAPGMLDNRIKN